MNFLNIFNNNQVTIVDVLTQEILLTNEVSQTYGLTLSPKEATEIIIARENTLKDYDRVELDNEILEKILLTFCTSPYLQQAEYMDTIIELLELFHYIKNEVNDSIGDDALIAMLFDLYNKNNGELELLKGKETEKIIRQYKFGDEDEENEDEDSKDEEFLYFQQGWEEDVWDL